MIDNNKPIMYITGNEEPGTEYEEICNGNSCEAVSFKKLIKEPAEIINKTNAGLIVIDLDSTGITRGILLLGRIQKDYSVPVLLLLDSENKIDADFIRESGLACLLLKPYDRNELRRIIEKLTGNNCRIKKIGQKSNWAYDVFDNINESFITVDAEGCVSYMNLSAQGLTGWNFDDAEGKPVEYIFDVSNMSERENENEDDVFLKLKDLALYRDDLYLYSKNGSVTPIEKNISLLTDETGTVTGSMILFDDITDLKWSEGMLYRLFKLVENNPVSIMITDVQGDIEYVNNTFIETSGYAVSDALGKNFEILKSGEHSSSFYENMWRTISSGLEWKGELCNKKKNGDRFWEYSIISSIKDNRKKIINYVSMNNDITVRKKTEKDLEYSEKRFRDLTFLVGDWVWETDLEFRFIYISGVINSILGYDAEEMIGKTPFDLMGDDDSKKLRQIFSECLTSGVPVYEFEVCYMSKEDRKVYLHTNALPVFDNNNNPVGLRGIDRDIRAFKLIREKLHWKRRVIEQSPNGIAFIDLEGNLNFLNSTWNLMHGYGDNENDSGTIRQFYTVESFETDIIPAFKKAMENGNWKGESRHLKKNGEVFTDDLSVSLIKNTDGIPEGYVVISHDLTDRLAAEKKAVETNEKIEFMMYNLPDIILTLERDYKIKFVNRTFSADVQSFIGTKADQYIYPEYRGRYVEAVDETFNNGTIQTIELKIKGSDGNDHWVVSRIVPVITKEGIREIMVIASDITEQKSAEEELRKLNIELDKKNRELEKILYVTSHDLRSPMINIEGWSKRLAAECSNSYSIIKDICPQSDEVIELYRIIDEKIPVSIDFINKAILNINSIITSLLYLSRAGRVQLNVQKLDMNSLVSDVVNKINETDADIHIGDLPSCSGDKKQMEQVFFSLLDNSIRFSDISKKTHISIKGELLDKTARFCVEDNGIGIALEHIDSVFDAFNRMKTDSGVRGLGLPVVSKIVERHGGRVYLESEEGTGSRFYVEIPAD